MNRFEARGVEFQLGARTKEQAERSFGYSCDCCCARGMRIDCDRCAIAENHKLVMAIFADKERAAARNGKRDQDQQQRRDTRDQRIR